VAARDPELRRLAARAGGAVKNGRPDAGDRRAELAEARLERHITSVVASAPALTDAQRDKIAALLRPGTDHSAVAS